MFKDDDGTIDLRGKGGAKISDSEPEFHIEHVDESPKETEVSEAPPVISHERPEAVHENPSDKVKVKFDKFVNLIATNNYEEIFDKYMDEDIIVSTSLLTDLASADEGKKDRKVPMFFVVGIILGIAITWFILRT